MSEICKRIFDSAEHLEIKVPDSCPVCHHGIEPMFIKGYYFDNNLNTAYRLLYVCPRKDCQEIFIASYTRSELSLHQEAPTFIGYAPFKYKGEEFSQAINDISPSFVEIYNQAKESENRKLNQICGLGYRKSLEFLIKDYLILKYPNKEQEIQENHKFSQVIKTYVDDDKVKFLAERASWLGNDHAHYMKKWETKDVTDIKRLINTTLYWISTEKELEHYMKEM